MSCVQLLPFPSPSTGSLGRSAVCIHQQSCLAKGNKEEWCSKHTKNSNSGKQTKSNFNSLKTKGMLSFYNGISHWIQISPFTALVINTFFIASVMLLHIWTKCDQCWVLLVHLQEWTVHKLGGRSKLLISSTYGSF
uniref:Uncharacterized protein n=1 Tax=Ficedula albicollis TaxID=59894 RepID=A0A803V7Y4_FICAL